MLTKLILIRHGETDFNYQKRYCGSTDIGLNKTGKIQAKRLSKRLNSTYRKTIHKVYSSDMKRVVQFATTVLKDMPIEKSAALREMDFGIFEGLTYHEIMDRYSDIYSTWIKNPLSINIPSGESLKHVAKRVRTAFKKIAMHNQGKTVAIFTHAGPLSIILCDILKLDLKEIWQMKQDTASMSIIEFNKTRSEIYLLNDTTHLHG